MNTNKRVGILGGTFNPIHIGHLILAERALEECELDEILFVPTGQPYFKSAAEVLEKKVRISMTGNAIEDNPNFALSTIETDREGNSYTYETLQILKKDNPDTHYYLILGADTLFQIEQWKNPEIIMSLAGIIAAVRDDKSHADLKVKADELVAKYDTEVNILRMPHIGVSSSDIRERIRTGKSVRYMLPEKTLEYIRKNELYLEQE
ncbi:MAG: nicotinate-nucleotide adenylyltransferase [Lachnospiraceae bacterium]|nr:nicotinate-nucleotide adenylyltransferase [Lachnospiraceae bacterium]